MSVAKHSDQDWRLVPKEFHYLRPWVEKYGLIGRTIYGGGPNFEQTATQEQLDDLRAAYREVAQREDSVAICAWADTVKPMTPENEIACPMIGVLMLFSRLGNAGIEPFVNGEAGVVIQPIKPPDWTLLPADLSHLRPLLERYEDLWSHGLIYEYLDSASPEQIDALLDVFAARDRDGDRVQRWFDEFRDTDYDVPGHKEASIAHTIIFDLPDFSGHLFRKPAED